eukprot:Skav212458  [mRNA]  locus=scaffold385:177937:193005:+ [translate_table: standard]
MINLLRIATCKLRAFIFNYEGEMYDVSGGTTQTWDAGGTAGTPYTTTTGVSPTGVGLVAAQQYKFRVRAVNKMGSGTWDTMDTGGHLCQSLIHGQHFRLQADIDDDAVTVTVINAQVNHYRYPILKVDDSATVLCHRQKTTADLTKLIETCVGIGGIGMGASFAGWQTVCRNDIQPSFCNWLKQQGGPTTVEGSITRMETIIAIHKCAPNAGTMSWGFACQPFSLLGDQRHAEDSRADTLPYGLYASWLLQVEFNILECVPQGGSSGFVQMCLDYHCSMTKGEKSEALLELGHIWASKRRRWWTILTKGSFGKVQIGNLPQVQPPPVFNNILSGFLTLPSVALNQLKLTENEMRAFTTYGKGLASQYVDPQDQLGTALHGWGNQVEACACGCRGPFSHARLTRGGLYGALCQCQDEHENQDTPSPKRVLADLIGALWNIRDVANGHETSVAQQLFKETLESQLQQPLRLSGPRETIHEQPQEMPDPHQPVTHESTSHEVPRSSASEGAAAVDQVFQVHTGGLLGFCPGTRVDAASPHAVPEEPTAVHLTPPQDEAPSVHADQQRSEEHAPASDAPEIVLATPTPEVTAGPIAVEASDVTDIHDASTEPDPVEDPHTGEAEPAPVEALVEPHSKRPKIWHDIPAHTLLEDHAAILDTATGQFRAVKVGPHTTIAQFRQAEAALSDGCTQATRLFTPLETTPSPDALLREVPLLLQGDTPAPWLIENLADRSIPMYGQPRATTMLLQGAAVAADEMDFYLVNVAEATMQNIGDPQFGLRHIGVIQHPRVSTSTAQLKALAPLPSDFLRDCGFQTIKWLMDHVQGGQSQPMTLQQAQQWRHMAWIKAYMGHLQADHFPLSLGGQTEAEIALLAVLKEHGVFQDRLQERCQLIMKKLGHQSVVRAFQSQKPWQQLKQLANQQVPAVRLVLEDEFAQTIKQRTANGQKVGTRKEQSQPAPAARPTPLRLHPQDVVIPEGVFAQQDGAPLAHISIDQLSATAKGVVLMDEAAFQPYRTPKPISKHGLAFLVMAPYTKETAKLGTQVRLPARSATSGEPVLMSACMIQKGEQSVTRSTPTVKHSVDQVPTQVVKIMVYKDQVDQEWSQVVTKPIRYILDHIPALQVCRQESCKCEAWRMTSENPSEPIIDLWARDFMSLQYTEVKPVDAAVFTCHMRLTQAAFQTVMANSSRGGIYCEPRTPDGRKHDNKYYTCWLAKQSFQEVQATKTTSPVQCSIVRVQQRYGLCALTTQGQALHEHCKPGKLFFGHAEKVTYRVGPMPFGTHRGAMSKLFQQWQWPAQVLQPLGRSCDNQGIMWQACSHVPPETTVYVMEHGIEASSLVRKTVQAKAMPLQGDPWADSATRLQLKPFAGPSPSQIANIEDVVAQRVLERVQRPEDDPMNANEARMTALEQQVQKLAQAQDAQQGHNQEVQNKLDHMQQQVDQQSTQFRQCLSSELQQQMQKIEALFSGRSRFKQELKRVSSPHRFSRGAPAPPKSHGRGCIGGKHTGVGFLASFPTRDQITDWETDLHSTGRIHAGRFLVGSSWIQGAVCYGYAAQSTNPEIDLASYHDQSHAVQVDTTMHVTQQYQTICAKYEQSLHDHLTAKGHAGLHPSARGRASAFDRVKLHGEASPVKPPRPGDPQVTFGGLNMQHTRWHCQLKRLTNLKHILAKGSQGLHAQEHRITLWHSIRAAAGFQQGFPTWWSNSQLQPPMPSQVPSPSVAAAIHATLMEVNQALDRQLQAQKTARWQQQYLRNTHQIFRDVANPRPDPVQVLVEDLTAEVKEVPYPNMVVLTQQVNFDVCQPVKVHDRHMDLIDQTGQQLWFQGHHHLAPGDTVVQLSLIDDPRLDPEYYATWVAVQQFRRMDCHDHVVPLISEVAITPPRQRKPGPLGVLLSRLQELQWYHDHHTVFQDEDGLLIDILHSPIQEVAHRVRRAWTRQVGALHDHRHDMHGLAQVDVTLSRIDPSFDEKAHGMLRALQNGTFCTNDQLHTAKAAEDAKCKFCGAQDSLFHRNMECPATEASRRQLPAHVLPIIRQLPICVHRGWFPELPSIHSYKIALQHIVDTTRAFEQLPSSHMQQDSLDLFTDGTGMYPTLPQARLVAWSVVSMPHHEDHEGSLVSAGGVPGIWQTVGRAEATGVLSALLFTIFTGKPTRLRVDNQCVVTRVRRIQQGTLTVHFAMTDSDLWFPISHALRILGDQVEIVKIDSHQDHDLADSWQQWAFRGNDTADRQAAQALNCLPTTVRDLSKQVATEWKDQRAVVQAWHEHLVRVAQLSIATPTAQGSCPVTSATIEDSPSHDLVALADYVQHHAPPYMQFPQWLKLITWIRTLGTGDLTAPEWISWYELQISFQLTTGERGLFSPRGNASWKLDPRLQVYDSKTSTRNLAKWMTHAIRLQQGDRSPNHMRPTNHRYQCWAMGLRTQWTKDAKAAVYEWLQMTWGSRNITQIGQLQHLPPADRNATPVEDTHGGGLHRFGWRVRVVFPDGCSTRLLLGRSGHAHKLRKAPRRAAQRRWDAIATVADAGGDAVASVTYEVYAGPTTGTMTAQTLGSPTDTFYSKAPEW